MPLRATGRREALKISQSRVASESGATHGLPGLISPLGGPIFLSEERRNEWRIRLSTT